MLLGKTNVYASIFQFEGQVSVFNYTNDAGETGPNYRDLFPTPPPPGMVPSCAEGGVLGVLPGIIGSIQALEVIKVASGVGEPLSGRLLLFDALGFTTHMLKIRKDKNNPLTGENPTQTVLIDYVEFCGMPHMEGEPEILGDLKQIDVQAFERMKQGKTGFQLIDVREPYEYEIVNIGGELMPQNQITSQTDKISREKMVIIHCRSGVRSAKVIQKLESEYGFANLYNLKGGILAYAEEIDPSLSVY